jgi:hypothetical protein
MSQIGASLTTISGITSTTTIGTSTLPYVLVLIVEDGSTTVSTSYIAYTLPASTTSSNGSPVTITPTSQSTTTPSIYAVTVLTTSTESSAIIYTPVSTYHYTNAEGSTTGASTIYGLTTSAYLTTYYTSESLAIGNSTAVATPAFSSASKGLGTGAKAGIGIGVTLTILIFAAIIAGWLFIRRRRKQQTRLSEVVSSGQGGYDKPELDATEVSKPPSEFAKREGYHKPELHKYTSQNPYMETRDHKIELDATEVPQTDGRAELDGRMIPKSNIIKRKELKKPKASTIVDEKEILHEI